MESWILTLVTVGSLQYAGGLVFLVNLCSLGSLSLAPELMLTGFEYCKSYATSLIKTPWEIIFLFLPSLSDHGSTLTFYRTPSVAPFLVFTLLHAFCSVSPFTKLLISDLLLSGTQNWQYIGVDPHCSTLAMVFYSYPSCKFSLWLQAIILWPPHEIVSPLSNSDLLPTPLWVKIDRYFPTSYLNCYLEKCAPFSQELSLTFKTSKYIQI